MGETLKSGHRETLLLMGLGDDKVVARQATIINWLNKSRPSEAQIQIFDIRHQTPEPFNEKSKRLVNFIEEHAGIKVVYAISGGAPYGMSLVPKLPKTTEYHFISGKLLYPESIGEERSNRAPALNDAVVACEQVIETYDMSEYNITCHAGYLDGVLEQKDMRIPEVPFERIHMVNRSAAILLAYFTILRGQ